MMKNLFKISILLLFVISCGMTTQDLSLSYKLSLGMTKNEVEKIMGPPITNDLQENVEEWSYCTTGGMKLKDISFDPSNIFDEYLILFFYEGKLVSRTNYRVTFKDVKGQTGSCEKFIKRGNYKVPDEVLEIRSRNKTITVE